MNLIITPNSDLVGYFQKHLVPIYFELTGIYKKKFIITSFVLSIRDQWLLVTAGHCIGDVNNLLNNHAYKISRCCLIDSGGLDAKHTEPIPFDYNGSSPVKLSDNPDYDYGLMFLDDNYRMLLEKNSIIPLNETVWKLQPKKVDFYMLLGVPWELFTTSINKVHFVTSLHKIEPLSERPDEFHETDAPTFYGRIKLGNNLTTIKGMSGGPIFSFHQKENGELKYWLHALQSRWVSGTRNIAACLTTPLASFLEEVMDGKHRHLLPP